MFTFFWAWQAVDEIVEVLVICDDIMMDTMTWNFAEYISVKRISVWNESVDQCPVYFKCICALYLSRSDQFMTR